MITWTLNRYGRLVRWFRTGIWCDHHGRWSDWELVDLGREKIRFCRSCGWMETTNHPWRGLLRRSR